VQKVDLIIRNGYILDFDKTGDEFSKQDIVIDSGRILFIGKATNYESSSEIDANEKIVMPGFVNTHTHIAMSYFKGIADDLPLMDWLQNHIWPLEAHFLNPEFVFDASLFGCAELIKNGITSFNDMYFFENQTAKAAKKIGIRATLGEAILDHNIDKSIQITQDLYKQYKDDNLINISVAPHAIYTCNKKSLKKARDLAIDLNLKMHIHLNESEFEVKESLRNFGKKPVEYLDEFVFFQAPTIAAHSLWLNENEQKIFSKNNVTVSINASSNYKLANGINSFQNYIKNGVNLSFGTDSVASNNNLSILSEINIFSKVQKALIQDSTFLTAKEVLKMATINGANILDNSHNSGKLEINQKADLITIDIDNIQSQPLYNMFSQLVYSIESEQIKDVIIDGKTVLINRKLVNVDESELLQKAKYWRDKIITFYRN
jgi:5-methylthioadenosine/S-adenosylhomocysteine deaminase